MGTARKAFLLLFVVAGALLLAVARDLGQENSLGLFLESDGLARYDSFRTRFDERPTLLGRLRTAKTADADDAALSTALDAVVARARSAGIELVTSADLPPAPVPADRTESSEPLLELQAPGSEAFLAILPPGGEVSPGQEFIAAVDDIASAAGLEADFAGVPYTRALLDQYSDAIGTTLFPLVFALGFVLVLVLTRELLGAIVVYVPALFATGLALASIERFYGSMDMVTSIVPLLVFVLNLGLALHLRAATRTLGSLGRGLEAKARPIALMVLTTSIGFGALTFSRIETIHRFGWLAGLLVIATSATTLIWTLLATPAERASERVRSGDPLGGRLVDAALHRFPRSAVAATLVVAALAGALGISTLPVETDAMAYFPASSGISARVAELQRDVLGTPVVELVATPPTEAQGKIEDLDAITRIVGEAVPGARVISRSALLREAHRRFDGRAVLPETGWLAGMLEGALPASLRRAYPEGDVERITIFAPNRTASEQRAELDAVMAALSRSAPGWTFTAEGMVHELLSAQDSLIRVLGRSFAFSLLVIAGLYAAVVRRWRLLLVFLVANAVPVVAGLGLVALFGFSLNVATVMVASVALGMIVDSTLHIVHALQAHGEEDRATYVGSTVVPILQSAAILIPCFLAFGAFGFLPIREFGVTLAVMIAIALLFDLYAVPVLVSWTHGADARDERQGNDTDDGAPVEAFSRAPVEEPEAALAARRSADGADPAAEHRPTAIVVGGGTAGLTFAARLAGQGGRVVVLEAADGPQRHVCGEYLCPSGVTVARDLGWPELLEGCSPIGGMVIVAPDGRTVTGDFPTDGDHDLGTAIDKQALIAKLAVRARAAGAELRYGTRVADYERIDGGWRVHCADGSTLETDLLVGADGRRSRVARKLGVVRPTEARRVAVRGFVEPIGIHARRGEMHVGEDGSYVGVNPISRTEVNISICLDRERLKELGGPRGAFDAWIARSPRLASRYDWSTLRDVRGAYPITHRVRTPVAERAALIGDAGGFLDPLTGEGITIALWTAATLADAVARCLPSPGAALEPRALESALAEFAAAKKRRFGSKLVLSRTLQWVIARPAVCNAIGRFLATSSERRRIFLGAIGNHYSPLRAALRMVCARPDTPRRAPLDASPTFAFDDGAADGRHA